MATIPVPLTTDVSPWLWYDAADPTMIRANASNVLTTWYNKGTSGSLTNGTITGSPTVGAPINGYNTVTFPTGSYFDTPSITPPARDASIFMVLSFPSTFVSTPGAYCQPIVGLSAGHVSTYFNNSSSNLVTTTGFNSVANTLSNTGPTVSSVGATPRLYTIVNSASTTANNYIGIDGSSRTPFGYNATAAGAYLTSSVHRLFYSATGYVGGTLAEIIVIRADISATQRFQIEGYLAWKWGLQANLPASHPYSVANKNATMALYGRPHGFTTVFVSGLTGARGVVCDSASNLYVARGTGNDIRKYNAAGVLQWTVSAAGGVSCNNPAYIARDSADNIYVAETTGQRILKITAAGSASVFKSSIPVGPITVDSAGAVYYYDTTALIKKLSADGATTTTFFSGAASTGLVCDASNNIYASHNFAITKISPAASGTTFVGTAGSAGSTDAIGADARFNNDANSSMSIDSRGYIYVAENSGKKIRMISPAGVVLTITGQAGTISPSAAYDNGIDINARYGAATGVAVAPDGSVYISDSLASNVRKIGVGAMNQVGTYTGPVNGGYAYNAVTASAYLPDGTMYFADDGNSRITRVTPSGVLTTYRTGRRCTWIAVDNHNNIYTQFPGTTIYKNTPAGLETVYSSDTTNISNAYAGVFDASNNMIIANLSLNKISVLSPTGTLSTLAGSGSASSGDGNGSGASFNLPIYINRGPSGNYYVSDLVSKKIRKVTPAGVVTTIADTTSLGDPIGIAVDSSENVYVSIRASSNTVGLIYMISPAGVVSLVAGGGSGTATDGVGSAATFVGNVYSISTDQYNNIFVADQSNFRFRMVARNAVPSGSVAISGTLTQGQTITADTSALVDVNSLGTLSYVWSASPNTNGVYTAISGATGSTLTLAEAQVAKYIKVSVSYTDGRGSAESVSTTTVSSIVNVNDTAVGLDISGTLAVGSTLTAITANIVDPDGNAPPYTYQWSSSTLPTSGFSNITGATSTSYTLTASEVNTYIRLTVSYTNNYGAADSAVATTASVVINLNSPVQGTLSISGDLIEGRTLSANTSNISDADGLGIFSYTWSSSSTIDGTFVVDASGSSTMTLVAGQAGRYIKLEVTYVDGKGNSEYIASSVVGPVFAATAPSAPQDASATPVQLGATLSWSVPSSDGYMPVQGYRVFDASSTLVVDTSGFTLDISGLNALQTYIYTVVAYNTKGNGSATTVSVVPLSPSITAIESGAIPEAVQIPLVIAGVEAIVEKITPTVESNGTKTVVFNPESETKAAVAIANLPAEVEKVVVASAPPQNGYTTLKISAFGADGNKLSDFATSPLTITLSIPGYTSETLLVRTFQEIGGAVSDSVVATRNLDGSYTMTLTHLTYIRVSQNVPCFVAGTKILTVVGYKAIEDIVDGELVATADGRALQCKVYITEVDSTTKENAPYLIPANTFSPRCPARDLTLSPLHAIQLRRGVWQIPKAAATIYAGVRQLPIGAACTYYHLEMPNYLTDNIVADGTVVESYGARQLKGRRVEYKFDDVVGGFIRTITEARRAAVKRA